MKKINKIGGNQIGMGIIAIALLLFISGFLFDSNISINEKNTYENQEYNNKYVDEFGYEQENYLFYLNETDIGRQKKVTQNFANIELGSEIKYNIIYQGNNFYLHANPFTANRYSFEININKIEDINNLLIYFKPKRTNGNQELIVRVDGKIISKNFGRNQDIPIKINNLRPKNLTTISFELEKPSWYSIFNWNKFEVTDLKIVEERQNKENNVREFDFIINKDNLEEIYVDVSILCSESKEIGEAIEILVNDQIISNENIDCLSKYKKITSEIPITILKNNQKNRITFKTTGFYKMAYALNKIYYNDQDIYKFNINSFNDIIDVIMYGDFDKDVIDIRINDKQTIYLKRDEIISIIPYLKFGTNEIKIITKPVEIKELIIEKNEYLY